MHRLLHPPDGSPGLSLTGARALARALRDAAETQQQRVLAAAGQSRACPFDLHALVPVPDRILRLGPDDPDSRAWLRQHWGTTRALRRAELAKGQRANTGSSEGRFLDPRLDGRNRRSARIAYTFWSADWTPWAALLPSAHAGPVSRSTCGRTTAMADRAQAGVVAEDTDANQAEAAPDGSCSGRDGAMIGQGLAAAGEGPSSPARSARRHAVGQLEPAAASAVRAGAASRRLRRADGPAARVGRAAADRPRKNVGAGAGRAVRRRAGATRRAGDDRAPGGLGRAGDAARAAALAADVSGERRGGGGSGARGGGRAAPSRRAGVPAARGGMAAGAAASRDRRLRAGGARRARRRSRPAMSG